MALPLLPDAIVNLKSLAHTLTHHNNCYCDLRIISNALCGCLPVVMAPIAPAVHIVVEGVVSRLEVRGRLSGKFLIGHSDCISPASLGYEVCCWLAR